MRRGIVAAVAIVLAGCPQPRPPDVPAAQFWSLVKITTDGSSFAFKCLHEQQPDAIRIKCFSPVEVPLFDISVAGDEVVTLAASGTVASKISFEIGLIGADVWRVHVAETDEDIASYNALNDPDLEEDEVVVERDAQGRPVGKTFLSGGDPVAEVVFSDYGQDHAGRIVLESLDPPYTLEVVQGASGG